MSEKIGIHHAFPPQEVSQQLRQRVSKAAEGHRAKNKKWSKIPALVLTSAAAVVCAFMFIPRAASAHTLAEIQAAYNGVHSYRMIGYSVNDSGKLVQTSVTEYLNGMMREDRGNQTTYCRQGSLLIFPPNSDSAIRYEDSRQRMQVDTVKQVFDRAGKEAWVKGLSIDQSAKFHGRDVIEVKFESMNEPNRMRFYADQKSLLPFRMELDWKSPDGGWILERAFDIAYDVNIDSSRLEPPVKSGRRIVNFANLKQDWQEKLDQGLMTISEGSAKVVIRDAVVLSSGDIMVLYTNGIDHIPYNSVEAHSPDHSTPSLVAVKGTKSEPYIPVGELQGAMYSTKDDFIRGFRIRGEDLQAAWYTPLHQAGAVRDAQLKFMDGSVSVWKTVQLRSVGETAEWSEVLGMAPRSGAEVEADAARYRAEYFLGRDNAASEREMKRSIQLDDMRMADIGEMMRHGDQYALLGSALRLQGKDVEARKAYEHAIRDNPDGKTNYEQLIKLLDKP